MKTKMYLPLLAMLLAAGFTATAQTEPIPEKVEQQVFKYVEKMPEFPGGHQALNQFMGSNIRFPETAMIEGRHGVVYVSFTVDKTGQVKDAKILKSDGEDFSAEVLRVVSLMPRWSPGEQEGEPVPVTYNLPVNFNITQPKEPVKKGKRKIMN